MSCCVCWHDEFWARDIAMFGVAVVRRVYVDCSMFCCVFGLGEFPREKLQLFNASAMFMWLVHVVLPYEFFSCEA